MNNSDCYWCDYDINKIDTPEEGYYCTLNLDDIHPCLIDAPCSMYCSADRMTDYIRYLIKNLERTDELIDRLVRLP